MIVVSDTTPLNYLILVDAVDLLPNLFHEVRTPPEVMRELRHARTPQKVREWSQAPPAWLRIMAPRAILPAVSQLDSGEAAAISLAQELMASAVLIDERKGAKIAQGIGLIVVRTLALLELAAEKNLIDFTATLQKLQATSFRIPPDYLASAVERVADKKRQEKKA